MRRSVETSHRRHGFTPPTARPATFLPARGRSFTDPALELLVALARGTLSSADVERARLAIESGVDWRRFHEGARRHRMLPIVHRHLTDHAVLSPLVPSGPALALSAMNARLLRRALWLTGELRNVLERLTREEIRVVPLKGPVLAEQLYGSVAMRMMGDLDVWVGEADLDRAVAALGSLGYRPDDEGRTAEAYREAFHHVGLVAPDRPRLELHFHLHPRIGGTHYGAVLDGRHLERTTFAGLSIWTMRPAELVVFLSMHGARHAWERLEWICGLGELVRGTTIDWSEVRRRAQEMDAVETVRASLALAHELLGAPIPPDERRLSRFSEAANRDVLRRIVAMREEPPTAGERLAYLLCTDDRWTLRVRRTWAEVSVPRGPDVAAIDIPRPLRGLYRVVRPIRLLLRGVSRMTRRRR